MLSENGIEEVLPFNKNAENAAELARRTFMSPGIQQPVEKKNKTITDSRDSGFEFVELSSDVGDSESTPSSTYSTLARLGLSASMLHLYYSSTPV